MQDINDNITNTDITGSQNTANGFFNNFSDNDFGLSSIITIPLGLIKSCTSSTCKPINLTIPFTNQTFDLPCMRDIYEQYFGSFLTIYQTITFGIVSYYVCINIFRLVKGFKDPNNDKIEVLDL